MQPVAAFTSGAIQFRRSDAGEAPHSNWVAHPSAVEEDRVEVVLGNDLILAAVLE